MAAIPSVVYGLWGLFWLQERSSPSPSGSAPISAGSRSSRCPTSIQRSAGHPHGLSPPRRCSRVSWLSMMVAPIASSIMREVFSQAPMGEREGAYALGASKWGMIRSVVYPLRGWAASSAARCWASAGARRDDRGVSRDLADLRHQLAGALHRHQLDQFADRPPLRGSDAVRGLRSDGGGLVLFAMTMLVNFVPDTSSSAPGRVRRARTGDDDDTDLLRRRADSPPACTCPVATPARTSPPRWPDPRRAHPETRRMLSGTAATTVTSSGSSEPGRQRSRRRPGWSRRSCRSRGRCRSC